MKKLFAVMLLVCATLTACGNEDASTPETTESTETVKSTEVESTEIETEPAEDTPEETEDVTTNSTVLDDTETETIPDVTVTEEPKTVDEQVSEFVDIAHSKSPCLDYGSTEVVLVAVDNSDESIIRAIVFTNTVDIDGCLWYCIPEAGVAALDSTSYCTVSEFIEDVDVRWSFILDKNEITWKEYDENFAN